MTAVTALRYTGSVASAVLATGLLALAALHAVAGVQASVLPALGGVVMLGGALAVASLLGFVAVGVLA